MRLSPHVLLACPPFTQLNTPYPATAYLQGFLQSRAVSCEQADWGIEVILALFSKKGLSSLFQSVDAESEMTEASKRLFLLRDEYLACVEPVISFLQGKNPTLALSICQGDFLPEGARFDEMQDLEWAFGSMGIQDKAKHLATLFLEDLADFIVEKVDPHFGFSRYAERLGRSAYSFDELYAALLQPPSFIDALLYECMERRFSVLAPDLLALTVPFPGNLFASLRAAQWVKRHYPQCKVAMGGGFANTELRSLADPRVFEFYDFVCLDDGEACIAALLEYLQGQRPVQELKRTFLCTEGKVLFMDGAKEKDVKQADLPCPSYAGLPLDAYLSVIEVVNPMHKLWSDGRWNKLTMAHGCYWGKCTFCDISLDYIKTYEPATASLLCDRMEKLMLETRQSGFHFVDEAAPPALMRDLALEIIRRKLKLTWWTNIRFEKSFSADLCQLLRASGCVAVSGGLEVASDRLLALIQKGVSVKQVAQVCRNFADAGIMVHAYLMYGFPSQTAQETVDSLEMVRQLFENGVLHSAYWHQFAMTAHSPIGLNPDSFAVKKLTQGIGSFANNDLEHEDKIDHSQFSFGLKKSLFNFMQGIGIDKPAHSWFEQKQAKTQVPANFIALALEEQEPRLKKRAKWVYLSALPLAKAQLKKGQEKTRLRFVGKQVEESLVLEPARAQWLMQTLESMQVQKSAGIGTDLLRESYTSAALGDFEPFWFDKVYPLLKPLGLLQL